ncbi:fasciclin domain-containing protein [Parasphingorhabdus halotolerans]|uniref:Fasciclin domain-containing protein n=1 Tax=Parasphingorhabdus halotolerans TaxID=2725558 RepID=A0A6H2DQZ0_9SPHN|nr:fasciclin domain-containing protein [Parasphingorhabdus halotolerans]QJB70375.1 fasciclin domain-containing protein [Parasphingorhabdus halotolerans]
MFSPRKLLVACVVLAMIPACSSEMSEEDKALYEERMAREKAKSPTVIMAVIQANPDLSTVATAVGVSGVAEALQAQSEGSGEYTVFAGTNEAFNKLGMDELNALLQPDKKEELANILRYHVVEGNMSAADIAKAIADGGGTASLTTVQGGVLKATMVGDTLVLTDAKGNKSTVTGADVKATNGTIHIIDNVLMPG